MTRDSLARTSRGFRLCALPPDVLISYTQEGADVVFRRVFDGQATPTLAEILAEHLPAGLVIDFMEIDAEGMDRAILESTDWTRHLPRHPLFEPTFERSSPESDTEAYQLTPNEDYLLYAKLLDTATSRDARGERGDVLGPAGRET